MGLYNVIHLIDFVKDLQAISRIVFPFAYADFGQTLCEHFEIHATVKMICDNFEIIKVSFVHIDVKQNMKYKHLKNTKYEILYNNYHHLLLTIIVLFLMCETYVFIRNNMQ